MPTRQPFPKLKSDPVAAAAAAAEDLDPSAAERLPTYPLSVVAVAFAAGVLCTTRPARELLRGVVRAAVVLAKPALVIGGLLKLREMADLPTPRPADKSLSSSIILPP
jgi:hypothetical protein